MTVNNLSCVLSGCFDGTLTRFCALLPCRYRGRTSPLSDVYSAGATLLYLGTRKMPSQFPEVRMKIDLDEVEMEGRLKAVVRGLLEPAVEDRLDARKALAILRGTGAMGTKTSAVVGGNLWDNQGVGAAITRKPVGSRVRVDGSDGSLCITIPPAKFDGAAVSMGGFALFWNAFVAFWTVSALASGGIIFSLFSLPFWFAGYSMAKTALARQLISEEWYMDDVSWRLSKRLAILSPKDTTRDFSKGSAQERVGFTSDLSQAKVSVRGYVNDVPQTDITIKHGVEEIVFGEGLDEVEQSYIAARINAFLLGDRLA